MTNKEIKDFLKTCPWWKKILWYVLAPFVVSWFALAWCVMKVGRGIYMAGDWMSGWGWNHGDWSEDV